jgi:hypothetical protein
MRSHRTDAREQFLERERLSKERAEDLKKK